MLRTKPVCGHLCMGLGMCRNITTTWCPCVLALANLKLHSTFDLGKLKHYGWEEEPPMTLQLLQARSGVKYEVGQSQRKSTDCLRDLLQHTVIPTKQKSCVGKTPGRKMQEDHVPWSEGASPSRWFSCAWPPGCPLNTAVLFCWYHCVL